MTDREEAGLRRLKQDLEEADWPSPELLARYVTEPNRLREDEKRAVERALASSRIVADELATLRGFDFSRLDADRRGAEADSVTAFRSWLRWLREGWLARPPVWAAAAALLALAYWLAQSDRGAGPVAVPEQPPQLAERVPAPTPIHPAPTVDPEVEGRAPTGETTAPDAAQIATSKPTPARAGEDEPPAPEPQAEILLAMTMPDYRPAYGIEPQSGAEWIVRGGESANVEIVALAPDHVTRTCRASPTLHWSIDRVPEKGELFLTIVDDGDEPVVLDRPIEMPARPGLQRIDLADASIALPEGRKLRWSIALRDDEAGPPVAFDFGWLRVETPDATTAAALAARGDATRAAGYAELGCYSEALDAALTARAKHPEDPAPQRAVALLAEQAGFDALLARD